MPVAAQALASEQGRAASDRDVTAPAPERRRAADQAKQPTKQAELEPEPASTPAESAEARAPQPLSDSDAGLDASGDSTAPTVETAPPATAQDVPAPGLGDQPTVEAVEVPGSDVSAGLDGLDLGGLLEHVVVSATKSAMKEDQVPAITTVISREEIRQWGYESVADMLNHVAGIYVIDDHILPNVGVRGVSGGLRSESGLIKVMINGRSVAFRSTAGNWLGAELIPMTAIQQIEIIRGPASALYGADAFLGIINIVTRRPDLVDGAEADLSGLDRHGHYGSSQDLTAAVASKRWEFLGSYRNSSDDRSGLRLPTSSPGAALPESAPADGRARGLDLGAQVALGMLTYHLGPKASATLTGYYSAIDRGAEFADWQQLTHNLDDAGRENGTRIALRQGFGNLGLTVTPSPKLDLHLNAMLFAGGTTARDRIETGSDFFYVKRDFGYRGIDTEAEASWRPTSDLTILVGTGVTSDREKLPVIYRVLKSSFGTNQAGDTVLSSGTPGSINLWSPGARALVMWTPRRQLSLVAGGRYDYHNIYHGQFSSRLGGVLALASNLHFKLLYGSAFKAPSPQLLYGSPITVGDISGNSSLRPSFVHTVEAELVHRPTTYLQWRTGLAYNDLHDQAEFTRVGLNQVAQNVSRVQSISWESELRLDYLRVIAGYGNVSLNRTWRHLDQSGYAARLGSYGNTAYPELVVHAGINGKLPRLPLRASVEGIFVTARPSSPNNTLALGRKYLLPEYFRLGASLRTAGLRLLPTGETSFALVARNLFDAQIADPGFAGIDYPQLGRTVMLHVIQEF
jgi:outer membrane receptor for ferrienterochelin and colicins